MFFTNQSKAVSINIRSILGGSFGGRRYLNTATLRVRLGDKFNSEFTLSRNDFDIPAGKFDANIFRTRLSYAFTPSIYTQALVQYNSVADLWSVNMRFGWLQKANTGLFLVYNQINEMTGLSQRSFTVKYSRVFDVLK